MFQNNRNLKNFNVFQNKIKVLKTATGNVHINFLQDISKLEERNFQEVDIFKYWNSTVIIKNLFPYVTAFSFNVFIFGLYVFFFYKRFLVNESAGRKNLKSFSWQLEENSIFFQLSINARLYECILKCSYIFGVRVPEW